MAAALLRGLLAALLAAAAAAQPKVIGAGLPKTGTESLSTALHMLGYGWDTHAHCNWPNKCQEAACIWMDKGNFTPLLEAVVDAQMGYVVDEPLCLVYRELAEAFPEAKVVLTVRDDSSTWYQSFAEMQGLIFQGSKKKRRTFTVDDFLAEGNWFDYCDQLPHIKFDCDIYSDDPLPGMVDRCKRGYEDHNAKVKREIPKERLLVFNVKQGWEPLCKFLGVPVPNVPFPRNNKYVEMLRFLRRREYYWWILTRAGLAVWLLLLLLLLRKFRHWLRRAVFGKKKAAE